MANYSLCISIASGSTPRFMVQAFSGTPSQAITISGLFGLGYTDGGCTTNTSSVSYSSVGTTFFPSTGSPNYIIPTSIPSPIVWNTTNYITIVNVTINGVLYNTEGTYTIGSDTVTIKFATCRTIGTFPCVVIPPTPTPTPSISPSNTPTNTPTPSVTNTPSTTPIVCGSGVTTGSYYYTNCCGQLVSGTASGVNVSFDYTKPFVGVTKLQVPATVSCPSPTPTSTNTPTPTNTRTPSNTPTSTVTPSITPSNTPSNTPSAVLKLQNTCDITTLFPLGASCLTLSQPTTSTSVDGSLSLLITGGTSPYNISWYRDNLYVGGGKTLLNKSAGSYRAVVVDFYGDYTATTFCDLVAPTPTPTPTSTTTPTPTVTPIWPKLCLYVVTPTQASTPLQFLPTTSSNGKPSWISGNYRILWDSNLKRWYITNLVVLGGQLVSTDTSNIPLASWSVAGIQGSTQPTISMLEGNCSTVVPLTVQIQKQDNSCSGGGPNSGSISILANGGTTPYQYSINGGGTFQNSNIFNGLAAGTYQVVTKDFLGVTVNNSVVISNTSSITAYTLSVQNFFSSNAQPGLVRTSWKVNVTPPIPIGTTINFNLNIDSYQYINGPGNGVIGSLSTVRKNGINQSVTTQTTDPVVITTRPFCAPNQTSATTINQNYSLSMTANDVISGNSTSSLTITNSQVDSNSGCATSLEQNINVFVDQVTIQGCTCCTAIGDSQSIGGVNGHTLQATQPDQTQNYYTFVLGLGNSPASACNDAQNGITRFCNCPIISSGCFVFTGSPINPQVVIGQSYMVNQTDLTIWELDSNSGQIIGQALDLAGVPLLC